MMKLRKFRLWWKKNDVTWKITSRLYVVFALSLSLWIVVSGLTSIIKLIIYGEY